MNERIKLLKHQASVWCDENIPEQFSEETNGYGQAWEDKFAELIVRECADICVNENVSNLDLKVIHESGKFTVQDLATKSCGENLAKRIKEHFGVKE